MLNKKLIQVFQLDYRVDYRMVEALNPDDYYKAEHMPIQEFGEDPEEIAAFFMAVSRGKLWYKRGMRPLTFGDVIAIGERVMTLTPADENKNYIQLTEWPDYTLRPEESYNVYYAK